MELEALKGEGAYMSDPLWTPSAWFLAEVNHVLASCCIVLLADRQGWRVGLVVLWMSLAVALKEFWADLTWLEHDTVVGSFTDAICYGIGALGTWLALYRPWWGVGVLSAAILGLTLWDILAQHCPNTFGP